MITPILLTIYLVCMILVFYIQNQYMFHITKLHLLWMLFISPILVIISIYKSYKLKTYATSKKKISKISYSKIWR